MEHHLSNLKKLCRICGLKLKSYSHDKKNETCKSLMSTSFGMDTTDEDEDIYPTSVCHNCYRTMQKIKKSVETRVAFNTDLKISTWVPHHEFCNICYGRNGGTKKVKSQGRPRNDDITHLSREMMRAVNTINPPKYTDLTLYSSLFLKSSFLDDLLC